MKLKLSAAIIISVLYTLPASAGKGNKAIGTKRIRVSHPQERATSNPEPTSQIKIERNINIQASNGRVYDVELRILVPEQEKAIIAAVGLGEKAGGYFSNVGMDTLTLKVRAEHLSKTLESLSKMGEVIEQRVSSYDGSKNKVTLASKIKSNREMMDQYMAIMNRSANFEELIAAERATQQLLMQLETATGSLRKLEHELTYATIRLNFRSTLKPTISTASDSKFAWMNTVGLDDTLRSGNMQSLPVDPTLDYPQEMIAEKNNGGSNSNGKIERVLDEVEIDEEETEYAH